MKVTLIKRDQPDKTSWLIELDDDELQEMLTASVFATKMRKEHKGTEILSAMTVAALCDKKVIDKTGAMEDKRVIEGMKDNGVTRFIFYATKAIRETETETEKGQS